MPTQKPGQIRCPTCHRSTPPAAFCTQCGAPLPASLRARPRGMDRDELDERLRQRNPSESPFRRGREADDAYTAFEPEPEDALATRPEDRPEEPPHYVDNTPRDFDDRPPVTRPSWPEEERFGGDYAAEPYQAEFGADYDAGELDADHKGYGQYSADDADAYGYTAPYGYAGAEERESRGSSLLPIIGFAALAIMALAVGVILAGVFGGAPIANETSTPSATASAGSSEGSASPEPTETPPGSEPGEATPEPTDGPVTFPDGAVITLQPCATSERNQSGCLVDGTTTSGDTVWIWVGFKKAFGDDEFEYTLSSGGETVNQQDTTLGSIVTCDDPCSGYIYGPAYRLDPGDYELVLRRNGDFADRVEFTVEG